MKKIVAKRKYRYPMGLEREYAKQIAGLVDGMFSTIKKQVPDMVKLIKANQIRFDLVVLNAFHHVIEIL